MANISSKELQSISDQLSCEAVLVKKYRMYAQNMSDMQLKTQCEQMATKHQQHFDRLLALLG